MPRLQEVRPGAKVPRSGIYQDRLSQRRATLVKGEPAPPTPHKAGRWQQVVDTASASVHRALPWTMISGLVMGAGLTLWVRSAPTRPARRPPPPPAPASGLCRGVVLAFCAGMVCGHCLASASSPSARRRTRGAPEARDPDSRRQREAARGGERTGYAARPRPHAHGVVLLGQASVMPDEPRGRRDDGAMHCGPVASHL